MTQFDPDTVFEPVSIGNSCAAKFQISRKLNDVLYPGTSEARFRLRMVPPDFGKKYFGKDLFDWQGTPIDAVSAYIERDFSGLFEFEDLVITTDALMHTRDDVNFIHYFELADMRGLVTPEGLEANYARVKRDFEQMCDVFRKRLSEPGPFLYIHRCNQFPDAAQIHRVLAALGSRSPEHRFHLLIVGEQPFDQDYAEFAGQVSKAYRTNDSAKPAGREWEDNDAEWDLALAPFKLRPPPQFAAEAPPTVQDAAPEPSRGGIASVFRRLAGR